MAGPHLRNSPLQLAACELRFPAKPKYAESTVESLASALDERYPTYTLDEGMNVQIGPSGVSQQPIVRHRFAADAGVSVAITSEAVVLESTTYVDIDNFVAQWEWIQVAVTDALRIRRVSRLGLRYVNQLELQEGPVQDALRWALDPRLLASWDVVGGTPLASLAELRTEHDESSMIVRHGLVAERTYLLDFDHFVEELGDPAVDRVVSKLRTFNEIIAHAFRAAVTDDQWQAFEPEEAP